MNEFLRQFFWPLITSLAIVAALINFGIAYTRRNAPTVMLVRIAAGLASLALGVVIILGKSMGLHPPFPLEWQTVFAATGAFIFVALWLPSYVDRNAPQETGHKSIQERAARPANATIRLTNGPSSDEWVN
jgi:hypothetical protein